jgi:hypothetical protein
VQLQCCEKKKNGSNVSIGLSLKLLQKQKVVILICIGRYSDGCFGQLVARVGAGRNMNHLLH